MSERPEQTPMVRERRSGDLRWVELGAPGWRLAFSTRTGGDSPAPLDSLNLGFSVGDDADNVRRNRARLCTALGLDPGALVGAGQVHGTRLTRVGSADRGRGATRPETTIAETDGLLTDTAGVALFMSFADCVPVCAIAETAEGVAAIALVHAGWRGLAAGIVGAACRALETYGGARMAVIGPSIGPCCYTVAPDVGERFEARTGGCYRDGHLDLWRVARAELLAGGVPGDAILNPGLCTSCDRRFFSHRRDRGLTGRQAAIAWVTGGGPMPAAGHGQRPGSES